MTDLTNHFEQLVANHQQRIRLTHVMLEALYEEKTQQATLNFLQERVREGLALEEEACESVLAPVIELLSDFAHVEATDLLIDMLCARNLLVAKTAWESLCELAEHDGTLVIEAIQRAVKRLPQDSFALKELPFLVLETAIANPVDVLSDFLSHPQAYVVASAIECSVSAGDQRVGLVLTKLLNDRREVTLEEEDEQTGEEHQVTMTIGELAKEAMLHLGIKLPEQHKKALPPVSGDKKKQKQQRK